MLNKNVITAVSLADGKMITTSQEANFNLFWLEEDGWTENVVEFQTHQSSESEQLVTVRSQGTKRYLSAISNIN